MRKKNIKDYPYWREVFEETSINCYTGGICTLLAEQNHDIREYELWMIGNGFDFLEGYDEYGAPEILFDVFSIVKRFLANYNCELIREDINFNDLEQDLSKRLKNGSLLVWVNSKHMAYSDLYYSNKGYVHAIVLNYYNKEMKLSRIVDNLIVSMPPWSCKADLHYDYLYQALHDKVITTSPLYIDIMGYFYTVKINENNMVINQQVLIEYLKEMTKKMVKAIEDGDSPIIRYSQKCSEYIKGVDNEKKQWMFKRMNDNIKTLYVLPNRNMLKNVLSQLNLLSSSENILSERIDHVIQDWTILANLCLKCSVSRHMKELDSLPECFERVKRTEDLFWQTLSETLEEGDGK